MPRIKIDLPDLFIFSTEIQIYIGHINYGHHLDNAVLLSLVSEARVRFLKSLGYSEMDIEGVGIIVADAAIQYLSESYHGDILIFEMTPTDFSVKGCDLTYLVREKISGRKVAQGKTGIVFFDYQNKKATAVPQRFIERCTQNP